MKLCTKCGELKDESAYGVSNCTKGGLRHSCKKCRFVGTVYEDIEARRAYYSQYYRKRKAKLNKNYAAWLRAKKEKKAPRPRPEDCEVCGRRNKNGHVLFFDHCHISGKFRGWLCGKCNTTLGQMADNPSWLRELAAYLEK